MSYHELYEINKQIYKNIVLLQDKKKNSHIIVGGSGRKNEDIRKELEETLESIKTKLHNMTANTNSSKSNSQNTEHVNSQNTERLKKINSKLERLVKLYTP